MRLGTPETVRPAAAGPVADVLVLGAGVIGVTTAYALARKGLSVVLVDQADGPGQGTSFANGAQLSYAYTDALAQPGLLKRIPALVAGMDPAFRVRLSPDPAFLRWGLAFLRNCSQARFRANTLATLELALESQAAMAELRNRHPFDFGHATPGKLHVFRDVASLDHARAVAVIKQRTGIEQHLLTPGQAIDREPALAGTGAFAGALWTPGEEVGDPYRFCLALLDILERDYAVRAQFGFPVARLQADGEYAHALRSDGEVISGRCAVVCLGADAARFLTPLGLRVPIRPMKGYSFTAPVGAQAPSISVTDTARKIVFCRLGGTLRVAGLAELGRSDRVVEPGRLRTLVDGARAALPAAADYAAAGDGWAGLRPMTPDSRPIIRQVRQRLFLNVGHGMLGWTFAAGAAQRIATLVAATQAAASSS
ncbi:FAD-dependent oxidoreductase [Novosphingobium profundi]|uniref:FAD-dependent oxidoreductase n=1 Tax=Novosphingobium profundi TaxID=1774954 RepID=UPI001BDA6337|nr:FAD-dependent oxidoreductase [Novosphingobium profundi]MBT0670451.1 FAD-dependent oxidoreductase [Novosphingobium profundi]